MLDGKVCVVAGGGRGLGRRTAEHLAERGASVVVNDRGTSVRGVGSDSSIAEGIAADIRSAGGRAIARPGDAADPDHAATLIGSAVEEYGRLDAVANFAAILRDGWIANLTGDDWHELMRVNLGSHFALLRAAVRQWRSISEERLEPQRSFLGVSSMGALGNPGQLNYSTAKAGVLGFARSASSELYPLNVRVNALVPSGFTRMTATVPVEKRPYTPEEMPPERVAPMVAYLVSDAARDVTGCTVFAGGDRIGLFSEPELERVEVREGGWTAEAIAEAMAGPMTDGFELTRTDRFI